MPRNQPKDYMRAPLDDEDARVTISTTNDKTGEEETIYDGTAGEFHDIANSIEAEKEFLINAGALSSAIRMLKPFISKEETRYYLNGIFFEIDAGTDLLSLVATDGIKLCVLTRPIDRQELFDYGALKAIIPTKALETIISMLKGINGECPVALRFTPTRVFVDTPEEKGEFRLIDGDYPEYRKVIPTVHPNFVIGLSKQQAMQALLALRTSTDKEPLRWEMVDEKSPLVIQGENKLVVVMPMRVSLPGEFIEVDSTPKDENVNDI